MKATSAPGLPAAEAMVAARRAFFWVFGLTLALKVALAAWLPMTGDEAFFYQWGVFPAWGYSDHPPMVGWLIWLLRHLGDSPLALRSFTVLLTSLIGLGLVDLARRLLPPSNESAAWLAGAVYLALPFSWFFVLVTTDTPLIFFMVLSTWCFVRAELAGRTRDETSAAAGRTEGAHPAAWYAAAGLLLGLAFLSKYFSVLLGLGYALWLLGWRRERAWALALIVLCALPGAAINLAFNATHGWPNIMFNVYNRNQGTRWSAEDFAIYLVMMVYLLTPWLVWQAARAGRGGHAGAARSVQNAQAAAVGAPVTATAGPAEAAAPARASRLLQVLWVAPFLLFALVALRRSVGLHWVLGFVPIFVLWAALRVPPEALRRSLRWTGWLALPHLLLLAALLAAPLAWWQSARQFGSVVFLREAPAITAALQKDLPPQAVLMARAYSPAAVLAFHTGRYVPVFGIGRFHARQDDQLIDFRSYEGGTIRVYDRAPIDEADFAPYFERVRVGRFEVAGAAFHYLDGEGFRFQPYRDTLLREAADRFHRVPRWLPLLGSPFCERYGFADCSPGR